MEASNYRSIVKSYEPRIEEYERKQREREQAKSGRPDLFSGKGKGKGKDSVPEPRETEKLVKPRLSDEEREKNF